MSSEVANNTKITVSEDKLDSKLARLELNLVDRITQALDTKADQAYVEQLHARVHAAEAATAANTLLITSNAAVLKDHEARSHAIHQDQETRLRGVERFKNAIPSVSALSLVVASAAIVLSYLHT